MLIVKAARAVLADEWCAKAANRAASCILAALSAWSILGVKREGIRCKSHEAVEAGVFERGERSGPEAKAVEAAVQSELDLAGRGKVEKYSRYDAEYSPCSSVLFTGEKKSLPLILKMREEFVRLPNKSKGCDVVVPVPPDRTLLEYFLVVELESASELKCKCENSVWQINSDILGLLRKTLPTECRTSVQSALFPARVFNKTTISCPNNEAAVGQLLKFFWHVNNLNSHSLGDYFYVILGEKAVFLSSLAPLVIVTGVVLLFIESASGGDFRLLTHYRSSPIKASILAACLWFSPVSSLLLPLLSYFDMFFVYAVLVVVNFPVGLLLAWSNIAIFLCDLAMKYRLAP